MSTHLQRRARMHQPSFTLHPRSFRLPVLVVCLLFASLLPASVSHAAGGIVYVKPGGTGNGSSWATAADLAPALLAAPAGSQLWVAQGTYRPTTTDANPRTATFALKNGVAIYGGFNGTETQLSQRDIKANPVILSGDIGTPSQLKDNSYHVVFADGVDATAVLDGVTITLGYADGPNITDPNGNVIYGEDGGGMYNVSSSPTLANIFFINNTATTGGGMVIFYSSNPTLTNVVFTANNAIGLNSGIAGGMYNLYSNPILTNVIFSGNTAQFFAGGMENYYSNPILTNVIFSGNTAHLWGGGMGNYSSKPTLINVGIIGNRALQGEGGGLEEAYSKMVLINVLIKDNVAATAGGGIYNQQGDLTLINVTITGNTAAQDGGGLYSHVSPLRLTNVLLAGNAAGSLGGGIYNDRNTATLANTTITNNTAPQGSGIWSSSGQHSKLTMHNSIIWDAIYNETSAASDVQYSDVQGGYPGTGNLNVNPQFVAPGSDYHLQATSPVIDQGSNSFVPSHITKDLSGNPRIVNGTVDMGAYEYQGPATGASK